MVPTASQLKAARELLGWSRHDVAGSCELDVAQTVSFEARLHDLRAHDLAKIRWTLEAAGVAFDRHGSGVKISVD